jgi:hypothetical protein
MEPIASEPEEQKAQCNRIHGKFIEMKNSVINRAQVGITLFSTSIVISAVITILFIPKVYTTITTLVPNLYYRLFVIFIFFISIVYVIERIVFNL